MAIDIKYQPEKEYVLIAVKGISSIEEFKTILDTITQSEEYPPNINTLWDVREQDFSSISLESMKSLIQISNNYPERGTAKVAFIVKGNLAYGMMRMYETFSSFEGLNLRQHLRVFKNFSEGEKWLLME